MDSLSTLREPFLEGIIHAAPIAIITVDKRLMIKLMNPRGFNYLELETDDMTFPIGKPITDFFMKFGPNATPVINNLLKFRFNFDLPDVKLGKRYLNVRCRPVLDGALMTFLNVNDLKEKESQVVNALLEGQELERKRFAQEIHDGIGPLLSTLKLAVQGLQSTSTSLTISEIRAESNKYIELIDQISVDIRSVSHALLPPTLTDFGLESALVNLCELVRKQSKAQIDCFVSKRDIRLEATAELGLYRIAQELLNNALKYSHASCIAIQLIRHATTVVLMVEDDGVGFDAVDLRKNMQGIGFKNIQARVASLGGTFSLETALNEGVLATVEIPLILKKIPASVA